jgi:hypothetical protein
MQTHRPYRNRTRPFFCYFFIASLVSLVLLLNSGAAKAQDEPFSQPFRPFDRSRPSRFAVGIGGFAPARQLRETSGRSLGGTLLVTYDATLPTRRAPFSVNLFLTTALLSRSVGRLDGESIEAERALYGGGLGATFHINHDRPVSFTFGAAGGVFRLEDRRVLSDSEGLLSGEEDELEAVWTHRLGYRLHAGIRFPRHWFLEASYTDAGRLEGVSYRGISFIIGQRF